MDKNWLTTLGGILTAIGAGLIIQEDATVKVIGQILSITGPIILGWAAKQYNVTGGSIPQPTPPGVAKKSDMMGVVAAVKSIPKPSYEEIKIKEMAERILAEPHDIPAILAAKDE